MTRPVAAIDLAAVRHALVARSVERASRVLVSKCESGDVVGVDLAIDAVRAEVQMATRGLLEAAVEMHRSSASCPN